LVSPIDGKGPIGGIYTRCLWKEKKAPGVIFRQPVTEPLQTGIKAVDAMILKLAGHVELVIATVKMV
jgi:F-type H+-transporting ATPase subunit alpha